jgi:TPR repeat protein
MTLSHRQIQQMRFNSKICFWNIRGMVHPQRKKAFVYYLKGARKGLKEANWRIAGCYLYDVGFYEVAQKTKIHAKKQQKKIHQMACFGLGGF